MQSLDSLVSTVDNGDLKYTHAAFPLANQFYLMKKKGEIKVFMGINFPYFNTIKQMGGGGGDEQV